MGTRSHSGVGRGSSAECRASRHGRTCKPASLSSVTALIRGDRVAAVRLLEELETILTTTPGGSRVQQQLTNLRPAHQEMRDRTAAFGPASLSTAELRVLQWLPTHLSFVQIGQRLYLSRHTVKTQALSIYRKLGTSSRSGAVELALDSGLLPASPSLP